jgi:hypothetical protein
LPPTGVVINLIENPTLASTTRGGQAKADLHLPEKQEVGLSCLSDKTIRNY